MIKIYILYIAKHDAGQWIDGAHEKVLRHNGNP